MTNNNNKHIIWSNDVCTEFDELKKSYEDNFNSQEIDEMPNNDTIWDEVYDNIETWFDDEMINLNINTNNKIVLVGNICRWDGKRPAYHFTDDKNIADAVKTAISSFQGDNTFELYIENNTMCLSQLGHDNPCNPSIIEFREINPKYLDEYGDIEFQNNADILKKTTSFAEKVKNVYGW